MDLRWNAVIDGPWLPGVWNTRPAWMASMVSASVVADADIAEALSATLGAELVITPGETGLSPTDRMSKATRPLLDVEIPGLGGSHSVA